MKRLKKVVAMMVCALVVAVLSAVPASASSRGDLVRFVPTEIEITTDEITVEGYFVNLNDDICVSDFEEVDMTVYIEDAELCSGDFGTINSFSVEPLSAYYQSFTFNNEAGYDEGTYDADESVYAKFSATFSYEER